MKSTDRYLGDILFLNTLARVQPIIHWAVISSRLWIPAYMLRTYGVVYAKLVHVLEINLQLHAKKDTSLRGHFINSLHHF